MCAELIQKAALVAAPPAAPALMNAPMVPQVTITPEGGGSPREIGQEDMDGTMDGTLCRKLSSSSISSTGSSAVESEDDVSDTESMSKGLVTLEPLMCSGEVSEQSLLFTLPCAVSMHSMSCLTSTKKSLHWTSLNFYLFFSILFRAHYK